MIRQAVVIKARNSTAERPKYTARSRLIHNPSTLVLRGQTSRLRHTVGIGLGQDGLGELDAGVQNCALDVLLGIVRLDVHLVGGVPEVVADGGLGWRHAAGAKLYGVRLAASRSGDDGPNTRWRQFVGDNGGSGRGLR